MKELVKVWLFASSSGSKNHETIQWSDGSLSCSCPGWCKRVSPDGSRTCKHLRLVQMGMAESEAASFLDYTKTPQPAANNQPPTKPNATKKDKATGRQFGEFKRKLI